jgi:hypothetical protein
VTTNASSNGSDERATERDPVESPVLFERRLVTGRDGSSGADELKGTRLNNKVVARFADGRVVKGSTSDFSPMKDTFHVAAVDAAPGSKPLRILTRDLKAVFFVKDFVGRPEYQPHQDFDPERLVTGRKIKVVFKDGEVLVGTTQGYQPDRPGLFMVPADSDSNIERCYIVAVATQEITLL